MARLEDKVRERDRERDRERERQRERETERERDRERDIERERPPNAPQILDRPPRQHHSLSISLSLSHMSLIAAFEAFQEECNIRTANQLVVLCNDAVSAVQRCCQLLSSMPLGREDSRDF